MLDGSIQVLYTRSDLCSVGSAEFVEQKWITWRVTLRHTSLATRRPPLHLARPPQSLTHISSAPWDKKNTQYSHTILALYLSSVCPSISPSVILHIVLVLHTWNWLSILNSTSRRLLRLISARWHVFTATLILWFKTSSVCPSIRAHCADPAMKISQYSSIMCAIWLSEREWVERCNKTVVFARENSLPPCLLSSVVWSRLQQAAW